MQKKKGISLIVLVITIIVMIILAAAVVLTLGNAGIINKANDAVKLQNYNQELTKFDLVKGDILAKNKGKITLTEYIAKLQEEGVITSNVVDGEDGSKIVTTVTPGFEAVLKQDGLSNVSVSLAEQESNKKKQAKITLDKTTINGTIIGSGTTTEVITVTTENVVGNLVWASDNESVVTVEGDNEKATVTMKGVGTAKITVTYGTVVAECLVTVEGTTPTISLDKTTIIESILKGSTKTVTITATTENVVDTLNWTIDNTNVATVAGNNKTATVTLKQEGTAIITVTAHGTSATCEIAVTELQPKITLSPATITKEITTGQTENVTVTATTENITETLSWTSNNTAVASVVGNNNTATVTLKKAGSATLTVTGGGATQTCTITVTEKASVSTLGALVTGPADYGKMVEYESNGIDEWQVLYEDPKTGYVYIVAKDVITGMSIDTGRSVTTLSEEDMERYLLFQVGDADKFTELHDSLEEENLRYYNQSAIAELIKTYAGYANKMTYGENYVLGAIGSMTIELFIASWNAMCKVPTLDTPYNDGENYYMNDVYIPLEPDNFLVFPYRGDEYRGYVLANPASVTNLWAVTDGLDYDDSFDGDGESWRGIRPVVCLSGDIPAKPNGTAGYSLIKQN